MRNRSRLRAVLLVSTAAASAVSVTPAMAQDTSVASPDQEIVVTALRGRDRQVDVPAAVTVVSADALKSAGVSKFQDLAIVTPGVQISRSGSYTQPAIRGITTTFAGNGQETNVGVYIDGFYQSDQLSINQDFANLDNVQVLKGPQSVLYGRNATGGAILITTKSPGDVPEMDAAVSYARYNDIIARAYAAVPVVQGLLSVGVAGYYRRSDGYFTDVNGFAPGVATRIPGIRHAQQADQVTEFQNQSIRVKAKLTPAAGASLTLGYNYTFVNDPRAFGYQLIGQSPYATYVPYLPGDLTQATRRDEVSLTFAPFNRSKRNEWTALGEIDLADGISLTTHTAYGKQQDTQVYDFDGTPVDGFEGYQHNIRKTFTQGVDLSAKLSDALTLLAGGFYYRDRFHTPVGISNFIGAASAITNDQSDVHFNTDSYSFYLDGTVTFGKLHFTAGARYNHDKKFLSRVDVFTVNGAVLPPVATGSAQNFGASRMKNHNVTPHAVIRYEIDPNTNLYASFSRGFKSGTINSAFPLNVLKPETVTAYEVGGKVQRGPFYADLSAFYYNYKNNQVSALSASTPNLSTFIQNSGGSHIYGVDGSFSYAFSRDFHIRAGVSYLHARYVDFGDANNVTLNAAGTGNATVTADWTGRRVARAPDWSGSVSADYGFDLAGGRLVTSGTMAFSSRYAPQNASYNCAYTMVMGVNTCAAGTSGTPGRFEENGWIVVNGQVAWTDPSEHLTLSVFAENLFNERYKIISAGSAYGTYEMYNQPRSVGARMEIKY